MRLIDADALKKKARDEAKGMAEPLGTELPIFVDWLVEKIPTIEPERKTGCLIKMGEELEKEKGSRG